jgi:hypothetical protein
LVAADAVEIFGVKGATDQATLVAPRALALDRTAVATRGARSIDRPLPGVIDPLPLERLPLWTAIDIEGAVVGEGGMVIIG